MKKKVNVGRIDFLSWDEVASSGIFMFICRVMLRTFGWTLVSIVRDGHIVSIIPVRVVYNGLPPDSEEELEEVISYVHDLVDGSSMSETKH